MQGSNLLSGNILSADYLMLIDVNFPLKFGV